MLSKIKRVFDIAGGFVGRHPIGSIGLAWIPSSLLTPLTPWSSSLGHSVWATVANIAFGMVSAAAYLYFVGRYEESLVRRVESREPARWNVIVNAVDVGTMSDGDYAGIQRDVVFSAVTFVRQCSALLNAAVTSFFRFTKDLPSALVWLIILCALVDPRSIASLIDYMQHTVWSTQAIHGGAIVVIKTVALFYVFAVVVTGIMNSIVHRDLQRAVNVQNIYSERIRVAIRQHMECAADGTVTMELRQPQGGAVRVTRSFHWDPMNGGTATAPGEVLSGLPVAAHKPEA